MEEKRSDEMEVAKEEKERKSKKVEKKTIKSLLETLEARKETSFRLWNVSWETGELLNLLVLLHKPAKILEIGTSNGFSTIWLAKDLKGELHTIEAREEIIGEAKENFKKSGLSNIKLLQGEALDILENTKDSYDMVFIDANKRQYIYYVKTLEKKCCIKENTVIVADNTLSHETTRPYLDYMEANYNTTTLDIDAGVSISLPKK